MACDRAGFPRRRDLRATARNLARRRARIWRRPAHAVFVAEHAERIAGTYYLRANTFEGESDIANCAYIVAADARRRGVARAMCAHSLEQARERRFSAMQFNFVVSTNDKAVRLWQSCGFAIVRTLPGAFVHPTRGPVDACVMFRKL